VEALPDGYYLVGDAAYVRSEHLLAPYSGSTREHEPNAIFNFYLSQLRIRIEMAFGLLTTKWRVLRKPLETSLTNGTTSKIIEVCATLHNFVLTEEPRHFEDDETVDRIIEESITEGSSAFLEHMPDEGDKEDIATTIAIKGTSILRDRIRDFIREK
jgi:hypothetical protein